MEFSAILEELSATKLALTLLLFVALLALRGVAISTLLKRIEQATERRRWLVHTRNATILLAIVVLVTIWADALRPFAVSILAFAVAVVIATKELIQSALGSMVRSATGAYSIGDRIEVGNFRGDVIDFNPLTTTVMEVGPGRSFHMRTGRTITFPNNKLLDTFLINESSTKQYVVHVFSVPLKAEQDWRRAEAILLEATLGECGAYLRDAKVKMKSLEQAEALNGLPVQPRVAIQLTDPGRLNLLVRFPVPVGRQGRAEQAIVRRFLDEFYGASGEDAGRAEQAQDKPLPFVEQAVAHGDFVI